MPDHPTVSLDQLRVGLYVYLDLKWFDHPFAFSHFKIKNEEQIKTLRSLGLKTIRFNPALSDSPVASSDSPPPAAAPAAEPEPDVSETLEAKRAMMARIKAQRQAAARVENDFINTAKTIREIEKRLFEQPAETVREASRLVTQITDALLSASDLAIHVMGDRLGGEELYFHSLNVAMLSMMIARDLRLPSEVIEALGMGALFHDLGRKKIPDSILLKQGALTQAEQNFYALHCEYGVEIAKELKLHHTTVAIIREHHEMFDGSGYPQQLKGEAIGLLSRIVAIANCYDELCNPRNMADALTPHEALSIMFAKLRSQFDPKLLQAFIRSLGVYPPGTIVQLSNGVIGMVVTVNTAKPMKPMLVIYDAEIPKDEAILVDMEREIDLNIVKALRPSQVPQNIYLYLSPRKRVSYYFDANKPGKEKKAK